MWGWNSDILTQSNHPIPQGVSVTVADNVKIHVEGSDKQKVGQLAAEIKKLLSC